MRYYLLIAVILPIFPACGLINKPEQPNILLILVDDMGFSDIGCYGGEIQTPNLDKLASEGLRFSRFYNTSKCYPSRACLLTGLYAQHNGMHRKALSFTNAVTIAEVQVYLAGINVGVGIRKIIPHRQHSGRGDLDPRRRSQSDRIC